MARQSARLAQIGTIASAGTTLLRMGGGSTKYTGGMKSDRNYYDPYNPGTTE